MTPAQKRASAAALAVAIAAPCEGLRQYAYRDVTGLPTICLGSTKGVHMGDFRTVPECKAMLTEEMSNVIETVDRCRPSLPTPVLSAFADAAYNLGPGVACNTTTSTPARKLAAGDIAGACRGLLQYDKARVGGMLISLPGLTKRRNLEYTLCMTGVE